MREGGSNMVTYRWDRHAPNMMDNLNKLLVSENSQAGVTLMTETGAGTVEPCGLFVDTNKPFLAASPDGVVGRDAVVEVKCPLKCADTSLDWLSGHDTTFCLQRDISGQN